MEGDKRYNGWRNYETWCVNLWLDNEKPSYRYWRQRAQDAWYEASETGSRTREEDARYTFADAMRDELCEIPEGVMGMYSDMLSAALAEVDWDEIAAHWLEDVDKSEDDES